MDNNYLDQDFFTEDDENERETLTENEYCDDSSSETNETSHQATIELVLNMQFQSWDLILTGTDFKKGFHTKKQDL